VIDVALLGIIRRWHIRDQIPIREIARRLDISRNTVRRYLRSEATEPTYAERRVVSGLDKFSVQLSVWLKAEASKPRKQRRNLRQIHADLKELGYEGSYDRVAAFARQWKAGQTEWVNSASKRTVRLFELPPNVALAAVRAFGEDDLKAPLTLKKVGSSVAVDTLSRVPFFKALCNEDIGQSVYLRATEEETKKEYIRVQVSARSGDKKLNKCLAQAISEGIIAKRISASVVAEKKNTDDNLKPDIRITFENGGIVCLEPTWRSTGAEIEGEIKSRQNTLTTGHIQMYVLEKVLGYVNELGF